MIVRRKRLRALLFLGIAAVAMILLAGSLSRLELLPAQPFTLEEPQSSAGDDLPGEGAPSAWAEIWAKVLVAMWLGMLACVPIGLVLLVVSPEARRQAASYLGPLLILLVVLLFPRAQTVEEVVSEPAPPAERSLPAAERTPTVFTPTPPSWVSSFTNVALGVAACAALAGTFLLMRRRWRRPPDPLEKLAQEAQMAIAAIQGGADLRETIIRCYYEMSRVLRRERGIVREQAMTPREFERHLGDLGLPQTPIRDLTRLFEAVRYGAKIPDKTDEDRAISSLSAVAELCRSRP